MLLFSVLRMIVKIQMLYNESILASLYFYAKGNYVERKDLKPFYSDKLNNEFAYFKEMMAIDRTHFLTCLSLRIQSKQEPEELIRFGR